MNAKFINEIIKEKKKEEEDESSEDKIKDE